MTITTEPAPATHPIWCYYPNDCSVNDGGDHRGPACIIELADGSELWVEIVQEPDGKTVIEIDRWEGYVAPLPPGLGCDGRHWMALDMEQARQLRDGLAELLVAYALEANS